MITNVLIPDHPEEQVSKFLSLIGQPARIQILLVIGAQAACVCHMEAALGMRQASISQHLMALRKAGLVTAHRDGRNIFYRLARPEVLELLQQAARLIAIDAQCFDNLAARPIPGCLCPQCNPDMDPRLACRPTTPKTKIQSVRE